MTTYRDIAQALVAADFLDKADVDAATAILANILAAVNITYTEQMAAAQADEVRQEEVIADAIEAADEFDEIRDFEDEALEWDVVNKASAQKRKDEEIVKRSQQALAQANRDAAAALEQAGLVEAGAIDDVTAVIAMVLEKGGPQEET